MTSWWHDETVVRRVVSDVIAGQMSTLRPTGFATPPSPYEPPLSLSRDLGVDSIELVGVASALNTMLHLHETGVEDQLLMRPTIGSWVETAIEGLETFSSAVTFQTSGSVAARKRCTHTVADLWQEVDTLATLFVDRRRVLSAVRSHHIYGFLFTALLPARLGVHGADVLDVRQVPPASFPSRLRPGDLIIGYPDFWRNLASEHPIFPEGVVGVTSTAPCPDDVASALEQAGLSALVQVYGSTETAGVGVRTSVHEPFALLPHWQHTDDNRGALVRVSSDGHRAVVPLQDILEWQDDRHFLPLGRIDDIVQVAGVNVSPVAVREAIVAHPDVADAVVRLMSAGSTPRLKAFVVPRGDDVDLDALQRELEADLGRRLAVAERPRAYTFGRALPVDGMGKAADWTDRGAGLAATRAT